MQADKMEPLDTGYEETLTRLLNCAITKAGSIDKLAAIFKCDRTTIHRWKSFGSDLKNVREPKARDWYKLKIFVGEQP